MSNSVGVQSRKNNQARKIKRIHKLALRILEKEFPNPKNRPSEQEFPDKWAIVKRSLEKSFGSLPDYKIAFNHVVRTIENYRKQYKWKTSAPTYIFTQKPEKQLRNEKWIKQAWAFQTSYQEWFEAIDNTSLINTIEQCYQALMLSFMCHSGHSNLHLTCAFSDSLAKRMNIKKMAELPFIQLQISATGFNTNIDSGEDAITQYTCYLSPITQGLLRKWSRFNLSHWKQPQDPQEIYHAITTNLNKSNEFPTTLKQLNSVAISVTEQLPLANLNQALVEYAIGNTKSYSLPENNLARLEQQQVIPCSITQFSGFG